MGDASASVGPFGTDGVLIVRNTAVAQSDCVDVRDQNNTEVFAVTTGPAAGDDYVLASCPLQVANPLTGFDSLVIADNIGGSARVQDGGRLRLSGDAIIAAHSAPASGDLSAGEMAIWFDQTNGAAKLMVKAKQQDGTVKTASLALA
jgi:hypothetical protein